MIFRSDLKDCDELANMGKPGEDFWVHARPINYQCRSFRQRVSEAWRVFTGECDCLKWTLQ